MQNIHRKNAIRYLLFHAALAAAAAMLLLWHFANRISNGKIVYCVLHDVFHLYCPFCGGTRVFLSLLSLNIPAAFVANPVIFFLIPIFLFFDLRALVRLMRRDSEPFRLPRRILPIVLAVIFGYAVVRNILLVGFGIDPLGDLLQYY